MKIKILTLLFLLPFLILCTNKREPEITEQDIKETKEALIGVNRMMVQKDKCRIMEYSDSLRLDLKETESGLWFRIKRFR